MERSVTDGERLVLLLVLVALLGHVVPQIPWPQWVRDAYAAVTSFLSEDEVDVAPPAPSPLQNPDGMQASLGVVQPAESAAAIAIISAVPVAPTGDSSGYDRNCSPGRGCVFGTSWTDNSTAAMGHDGCDTRNNILGRDGTQTVLKAGQTCKVLSTVLLDPYTGSELTGLEDIQIDHVYPLSLAWRMGAASWPMQTRTAFANDPLNLLAVDAAANQEKSDSGPGEWLPPNTAVQCAYAVRFAQVAVRYGLPMSEDDRAAALEACR